MYIIFLNLLAAEARRIFESQTFRDARFLRLIAKFLSSKRERKKRNDVGRECTQEKKLKFHSIMRNINAIITSVGVRLE